MPMTALPLRRIPSQAITIANIATIKIDPKGAGHPFIAEKNIINTYNLIIFHLSLENKTPDFVFNTCNITEIKNFWTCLRTMNIAEDLNFSVNFSATQLLSKLNLLKLWIQTQTNQANAL